MARFERKAHVLASLNHPNIASIYGLEEADGIHCLVLELVEGPTLAERIKEGAIPLEESLNIAKQIAEALEAAHEKIVIHRDLKPALRCGLIGFQRLLGISFAASHEKGEEFENCRKEIGGEMFGEMQHHSGSGFVVREMKPGSLCVEPACHLGIRRFRKAVNTVG